MKPPSASITASIPIRNWEYAFSTSPAGARRILGGWRWSGWFWCCVWSCWWFSRHMAEQSSPAGSDRRGKGASERRVQSRSTPSKAKPGSLWTCGPAPSPAATPRVCHRPPDCIGDHHTLQHIQVHFGADFRAVIEDVRWHDMALTWNHTKDHNRNRKFCFDHPGYVPLICGNPAMVLAVITRIGREHWLYSGASPISLVEHCVTFRHDRRLLSLLGFVHNWLTSRWSATAKENRFSLNGNAIMLSFLGRQFYHPPCK